jgi:hypothetical protein
VAHFRPQQGFQEDGHQERLVPRRSVCLDEVLTVDFIAMLGEYVGTVLFMIFALGGTK